MMGTIITMPTSRYDPNITWNFSATIHRHTPLRCPLPCLHPDSVLPHQRREQPYSINGLFGIVVILNWRLIVIFVAAIFTAQCYAERRYDFMSSVRLTVTFRYRDHIGWNSSKIISPPNSLKSLLTFTPTWAIWYNGNTPKLGWNRGGVRST